MTKNTLKILMPVLLILIFSCTDKLGKKNNLLNNSQYSSLVDLVNPLMGTDSKFSLSNGNTYPAIATPWGMNFWTPQTAKMGDGWAYKYDDETIRGIKQTHQPSPWINDYASFSLMAVTGELKFQEDKRASWFSHKAEEASPHYYKTYLADYDVINYDPNKNQSYEDMHLDILNNNINKACTYSESLKVLDLINKINKCK